jgi:hypothetical protein
MSEVCGPYRHAPQKVTPVKDFPVERLLVSNTKTSHNVRISQYNVSNTKTSQNVRISQYNVSNIKTSQNVRISQYNVSNTKTSHNVRISQYNVCKTTGSKLLVSIFAQTSDFQERITDVKREMAVY